MGGRIFFMSMQTKSCNSPQQEIPSVYQGLIVQANIPTDWLVTCKGVEAKLRARYLMSFLVLGGEKKIIINAVVGFIKYNGLDTV